MNWIDRLIWRILAVVVVLLVNVLVDYRLKSIELERSMLESDRLRASLDDPISHVDYLITIYSPSTSKPCSYFSEDRYSQAESSLINCTWYKSNACCKRTEVASVFLTMYTLNTEDKMCMNLMNYMMCFFCSPEQYIWYRRSQVSICLKFCEEIYSHCKLAEYGGKLLGDVYKDGRSFCEAQDFKIVDANYQCFEFDPSPFSRAATRFTYLSLKHSCIYAFIYFFIQRFLNRLCFLY